MVLGRVGVLAFFEFRERSAWSFNAASPGDPRIMGSARVTFEATMFRISRGESGFDSDTLERAREILREGKPGRYHVAEIRADPFPSGHTSRAWGSLIRHADGRVENERWPSKH